MKAYLYCRAVPQDRAVGGKLHDLLLLIDTSYGIAKFFKFNLVPVVKKKLAL